MNNVTLVDKKKCVSCRSCQQTCPKKSISFVENEEGFIYPEINKETCIDCGLCLKKCPIYNNEDFPEYNQKAYALRLKDKENLRNSASGGAFFGIARAFIENNGVVFGAAYVENNEINTIEAYKISDLKLLQGSKYVASDTKESYTRVLDLLKNNKKVLYTGLPCQIAGLKKFIGKDYENLFTVDLICHGVPSRKLYNSYRTFIGKGKKTVENFNFRDKSVGGWSAIGSYLVNNKKKKIYSALDRYYISFELGMTFRDSCYNCKYAKTNRISDITIGDFWGIKDVFPAFYSRDGVSVGVVNSQKGENLIQSCEALFLTEKTEISVIANYNDNFVRPFPRPKVRDYIYNDLGKSGYWNKFFLRILNKRVLKMMFIQSVLLLIPSWLKKELRKLKK